MLTMQSSDLMNPSSRDRPYRGSTMIIDCHAHYVPPALLEEIRGRAADFPNVKLAGAEGGDFGFSFTGGKPTRPVAKPLRDLAARLAWMDDNAIGRQVVGGWLDMFGYELPAAEGVAWSRLANAHLKRAAGAEPRLVPLATVPLQEGAAAADVLQEVMEGGFRGTMIGTQPKGVGGVLDDPSLDPFWRMADRTGAVVFIHPVFESGDNRVHDYGMANAVGRITDTLVAVARLLYAGHPLRYSNAKIVVGIGGAALPFILGRMQRNRSLDRSLADPEAGLQAMWYDTLVHDSRTLRFVAEIVGADRLMLGSDAPFPIGDLKPAAIIEAARFPLDEQAAMRYGTAATLFGLQGQ
jgi:aminocarboxymuconate-semialdehyde decarboxylase